MTPYSWSRPYYGVSHCFPANHRLTRDYWATISDYGSFVDLALWSPDCGFSPESQRHDSIAAAKAAAESWIAAQFSPSPPSPSIP